MAIAACAPPRSLECRELNGQDGHSHDDGGTERLLLRLARGRRRLGPGGVRLGRGLLRATHLPERRAGDEGLAGRADLGSHHRALSRRCHRRGEPALPAPALRLRDRHQGGRHLSGGGLLWMGRGGRALATLCRRRAERAGLGCDERLRHQCHRLAVVHSLAPGGTRHGLQRRQHRRRDLLTAVGGEHRRAGLPGRDRRDRPRHGAHRMAAGRPVPRPHAATDGAGTRRRCGWRAGGLRHVAGGGAFARTHCCGETAAS